MLGMLMGKKDPLVVGAEKKAGGFLAKGKRTPTVTMQDIQNAQQNLSNIQSATVRAKIREAEWKEVGNLVDAHYKAEGARLDTTGKVIEGETNNLEKLAQNQVKVNNYQMTGWRVVQDAQQSIRKLL